MSNSLLYHGFGLRDVDYYKTEYLKGEIKMHVRTKPEKLCCSNCDSFEVIKKGLISRMFRTVPIGLTPVFIVAQIQRLYCKSCGLTRQEHLSWADKKKLIPVN